MTRYEAEECLPFPAEGVQSIGDLQPEPEDLKFIDVSQSSV
jgi:hypothetical protein